MLNQEKRDSGIKVIGKVSWGFHLCHFYQTKEEIIEILVPYFKAGLENNEACIWVTSEPVNSSVALMEMKKVMPDFDNYLKKGQIEILSFDAWYLKNGFFDKKKVLNDWKNKLNEALKKGYDGLRVTGNTYWLEEKDWNNFSDYEADINQEISNHKIIVLCSYSLNKCSSQKIIQVIQNHQEAIIKQGEGWAMLQGMSLKKAENALEQSEEIFQNLYNSMTDGIFIMEMLYDDFGNAKDYKFLDINKAYESIVGSGRLDRIGKTGSECYQKPICLDFLSKVVKTGKPQYYETDHISNKNFQCSAFSLGGDKVGVVFSDITQKKKAEKEIRHLTSFPELNPMPVFEINGNGEVIYYNSVSLNYFPKIKKEGIKHSVFSEINFDFIKKKGQQSRVIKVGDKWFKQEIDYCPEMDTIRIYCVDITDSKEIEQKHKNFLSILGHELRNPLASITLLLDLMEQSGQKEIDFKQTLKKLKQQTDIVSSLVKDLLDISRIERGIITLNKRQIDLVKLIRNISRNYQTLLIQNNQRLELVIPNEKIVVNADPLRLEQIFINLLNNASKFSPHNSPIEMYVEKHNSQVLIKVKDYGAGIPFTSTTSIFDLYAREENAWNQKNEGLGVGLYLSRQLARLHDGDIDVYSGELSKGSEFIVSLPFIENKNVSGNKYKKKITPEPQSIKPKVLVVDDNVMLLETLKEVVNRLGCEVKASSDGYGALKIIKDFKPQIALIDLGMPGMDGLSLAKKIRASKNICQPTLIAITGYGQETDKDLAQKAGFDNYVIKPLRIKELSKILSIPKV